ncbi:Mu-like prophage DNA circulation protein [Chelatococcus sambhunathii]|uniref:Mu-like prophage DNA circulation protein n=1 Tax=Chelatococcus sambhunathii TaxID=363953 RepID=A0ABM9U8T7_9HYPH|nr:DNA circularization N-terminal domain-containing protein [Chelatococcus sambhunathii]CUA90226.1 Mu-like prophage DNA circulation protein [Chelatococcus sambhunathii]
MRDWSRTLFHASFRGVPFWVEVDEERGGRRIVTHEFPMRDEPFHEDLGEKAAIFSVTAYLASDAADAEAAALASASRARGPAVLVLPMHGPLTARCVDFRRSRERDRAGYVAYELDFVREGATVAIASVAFLAQQVFNAVDALAGIIGGAYAELTDVRRRPDYAVAAAVDAAQDAAATLEVVRTSQPVDPEVSAGARDAIAALHDEAPALIIRAAGAAPEVAERIFAIARNLGDGLPADAAVGAFREIVAIRPFVEPARTDGERAAAQNRSITGLVLRLAALAAMVEATTRRQFDGRRDAITARGELAELIAREQAGMTGAAYAALYLASEDMSGRAVDLLSRQIADIAPIVTVTVPRALPSLWHAWRLYGDPNRADDLVRRNRVVHPSFMPERFEALGN